MGVLWSTSQWNSRTKSKKWELFIRIIELQNISHCIECLVILIIPKIVIVKWISILRSAITQSEINSYSKVQLTSTKDVLQETVSLLNLQLGESQFSSFLLYETQFNVAVSFKFSNSEQYTADVFVTTIFRRLKEFNFYVFFLVSCTNILDQSWKLGEFKLSLIPVWIWRLALRFVNRLPNMITSSRSILCAVHPVNNIKEQRWLIACILECKLWHHNELLFITCSLKFFGCNFNGWIFLSLADWSYQDLVFCCDDFVQGEFKSANKIMAIPVLEIIEVIYIIDSNFELLLLFKLVWNIKAFNPLRVEAIHNNFSHAKNLPHVSSLLK